MNKNTIKGKLLFLVLLSTFISFCILGFYNTKNSYTAENNLIKQRSLTLAKDTSRFINSYLQSKINILEAVADELQEEEITLENEKVIEKLLLAKKSGLFVDFYIGFENDGSIVLSSGRILNIEKDDYDARTRPWYKDALDIKKSGISSAYLDDETKKLVVSVYTPLMQKGKLIGVIGSDIFIDTIVKSILNIDLDNKGLAYVINKNDEIIIHKDKELFNKKDILYSQVKNDKKVGFAEASLEDVKKLVSFSSIDTADWKIIIELDKDLVYENINNKLFMEVIIYVGLLLIILFILFYALSKILAPLRELQNGFDFFFRYLKGEEESIKKIELETKDEFGVMAKVINSEMEIIALNIDKDRELINNVKEVVGQVKEGKLNVKVENSTSNKSLDELKDILNEMIETISINVNTDINPILAQLKEYSKLNFMDNIPDANGNIAKGLNDLCTIINKMLQENKHNGLALENSSKVLLENVDVLNKSSTETAVSLEETAAALEEITSTVISNTNRITEMSNHSNELSDSIKKGQSLASSTVTSMDEINEQTQAIADAITVIDQIAFQTNILSLNAAVEAATAGEAGKGFAVVAQEVRNLASRSAEAAKEIKDLVENATQKTNSGKQIADEMITGYTKLNENILKTTEAIVDISEASKEQRTSIEQINDVITRLDQQSQNNASVANQAHGIAENTSKLALRILKAVNENKFREK